jgi:hypothetical protein
MGDFLEALITLLPSDAGGRLSAPRDGSYRPFAVMSDGARLRVRIIEGPPAIAPGQHGRVVVEIETASDLQSLAPGAEIDLLEHDRCIGILRVNRACRAATV